MDQVRQIDPREACVLSLHRNVRVAVEPRGPLQLRATAEHLTLDPASPGVRRAVEVLAGEGATRDRLADVVLEADGPAFLPHLFYVLEWLAGQAGLCASVAWAGRPALTLEPTAPSFRFGPAAIADDVPLLLSRFALVRRDGENLALESPRAPARIVLRDGRALALLSELSQPRSIAALADRTGLAPDPLVQTLALLANAQAITTVQPNGGTAEDADLTLVTWEFHDLLFHARSRPGRSDGATGATFPFVGRLPPPPALKEVPRAGGQGDGVVRLHRPDLEVLRRDDPPFTRILESRASVRDFGARSLTDRQLGEFLFRVARVRALRPANPADPLSYEATRRPYPSGGACYPLELYLTIDRCAGIRPGLHYYDPRDHALIQLSDPTERTGHLLRDAMLAMGTATPPPVLTTLAARFGRLAWKYRGMAYATVLKDVGVLYQTMYLVATAMGLAPCALGGGDSDLLAEAAGLTWAAESAVGEFALGG